MRGRFFSIILVAFTIYFTLWFINAKSIEYPEYPPLEPTDTLTPSPLDTLPDEYPDLMEQDMEQSSPTLSPYPIPSKRPAPTISGVPHPVRSSLPIFMPSPSGLPTKVTYYKKKFF
jgi:hypothetical protein